MQYAKISWQKNQPYSEDFDDVFISREGGCAEVQHVFLQNNDLPQRWLQADRFVIGETGFGTGLNFLVTAEAWLKTARADATLYYFSAEKYPLHRTDLQRAMTAWPDLSGLAHELLLNLPAAVTGYHYIELFERRVVLVLMLGDVLDMLSQMTTRIDAWYLDGFTPARNPDMWSSAVLREIVANSHAHTTFSSYTVAGDVQRGLTAAGFSVNKVKGSSSQQEMLRGQLLQPVSKVDSTPWYSLSTQRSQSKKIAIIGAGIAGISSARSLAQRGWQVDLFDEHSDFAMAGSGNPAGVLLPRIAADDSPESVFYAAAFFQALRELSALKTKYPTLGWRQTGVVQLLSSERLRKQYNHLDLVADYVQSITASQASEISGVQLEAEALFYPLAGWLEPRSLCEVLLADAQETVHTTFNVNVNRLQRHEDAWVLYDQNQRELGNYHTVLLANAQQARQYEQTSWLSLLPARGQISYMPMSEISQNLLCPVCYDGYVLPAFNQYHVLGASFESGNDSTDLSNSEHAQNYRNLQQYVPALIPPDEVTAGANMTGRAALRAVTPDRMPLVGAVPDMKYFGQYYADLSKGRRGSRHPAAEYLPGLFVNVGHGARGLTSAFVTAELVAAMITNDVLPITRQLMQALHPARFFIRQSRKGKLSVS